MRPLVGLSADCRKSGQLSFHGVEEMYIRAILKGADGLSVLIPALKDDLHAVELVDRLDGLLFTGSESNVEPNRYGGSASAAGTLHDPARDATTLPLVRQAIAKGVPIFGICRGFQEINVALGGKLHQRVHEVQGFLDHRDDESQPLESKYAPVHDVVLDPEGVLRSLAGRDRVRVNSRHCQGIECLAQGLVVEARAPDGLIEAFRVEGAAGFALAVQWHPEWQVMDNPLSRALFWKFGTACRDRARSRASGIRSSGVFVES